MAEALKRIIAAGETVELSCPEGSASNLRAGERLHFSSKGPKGEAVQEAIFTVLKVEKEKITLGPLKAGESSFTLYCLNAEGKEVAQLKPEISVNLPRGDQMPERENPLDPLPFVFALWIWILLVALLLAAIATPLLVRWNRKRKEKKKAAPPPPPPPPDEALQRYLKAAQKNMLETRELYVQGNDRLRAFLEYRLGFDASADTTREFLGVLQAALTRKKIGDPRLPALVQGVLTQSDNVRFANEKPNDEAQKAFVKNIAEIMAALPAPPPPVSAAPTATKKGAR